MSQSDGAVEEHGSVVGLVDFDHSQRLKEMEQEIRKIQDGAYSSFKSCRWRAGDIYSSDDSCPAGAAKVLYYNPHSEPRILCDQTIAPLSHQIFDRPCAEPARLFPVIPDVTAQGLPPVNTCFDTCQGRPAKPFADCDIPCMQSGTYSIITKRYIEGTDWEITFSMEGPQYYPHLRIQRDAYKKNKFYSTTSYDSEIPLPYFSWSEYNIQSPPLKYDDAIKGAVFLARNCDSKNHREDVLKKLEKSAFRVDSLSSCLRNAKPPKGVDLSNKVQVMRHYLFYLAFENQNEPDYVTEKLWGPLVAGTVPVYFGAPNVKDHAPNQSIIMVDDFASIDELAAYLNKVANDKALYEKYQAWRSLPLPPHFHARYDFTKVHSTCRTCRWAHAKLYGLGWDHKNQSLVELRIPRKVCFDEQGMVHQPFREEWLTGNGELLTETSKGAASCDKLPWSGSSQFVVPGQLRRTVYEQDGVIELLVDSLDATTNNYILRLQLPFESKITFSSIGDGHGRIQDLQTRFTFLARPKRLGMKFADDGRIEVVVQSTQMPLRIRIIVEDVDTLHEGADQEKSYYGQRMIKEFYEPIEGFIKM
jgi:hypothetical protein